jgi:hypothetical protein
MALASRDDEIYSIRQRKLVGPFLIGSIVQALSLGIICSKYWMILTRSKCRPSRPLHVFLSALVILNITNQGATFAVSSCCQAMTC